MSVITVSKSFSEVSDLLGRRADVPAVVLGCDKCAKLSHTGGAEEVRLLRQRLSDSGVGVAEVPGLPDAVEEGLCDPKAVPERLAVLKGNAGDFQILVLSCGAGLKCVKDTLPGTVILPGLDTLGPGVKGELACLSCGHCRFGQEGCAMLAVARLQAERLVLGYEARP